MNKKIMIEVGKRIKRVREYLKINQKEFAAKLGITTENLSEIENGKTKPGFDFFYKADEIFNINLLYILKGKEPMMLEPSLWERPTVKMCENLLKSKGQEFRELIQRMYESDSAYRSVIDNFVISRLIKNDWR